MKYLLPLLIAIQFLTKLPIHLPNIPTPKQNAYSVLYYPLIGVLMGVILWIGAIYLPVPTIAKGAILTAFWVWITGGLHLDGLADSIDGFVGGYGNQQKTLDIMKDPHIGAMGVMAIVIALLLKFAFIVELLKMGYFLGLVIAPIFGRLSLLFLLLTTPYVRQNGLGLALSQHLPKKLTLMVLLLSLLAIFIISINIAMMTIFIFLLMGLYLRQWFIQRIGGITGDTLGAGVEMMEVLILGISVIMTNL